jgi:hypothetical protein
MRQKSRSSLQYPNELSVRQQSDKFSLCSNNLADCVLTYETKDFSYSVRSKERDLKTKKQYIFTVFKKESWMAELRISQYPLLTLRYDPLTQKAIAQLKAANPGKPRSVIIREAIALAVSNLKTI